MRKIPLTQGKFALVDNCDFEKFKIFNWHINKNRNHLCASRFVRPIPGWNALIRTNGKLITIGQYPTKEIAAKAYNRAAKKYFGEFARLNKIPKH